MKHFRQAHDPRRERLLLVGEFLWLLVILIALVMAMTSNLVGTAFAGAAILSGAGVLQRLNDR